MPCVLCVCVCVLRPRRFEKVARCVGNPMPLCTGGYVRYGMVGCLPWPRVKITAEWNAKLGDPGGLRLVLDNVNLDLLGGEDEAAPP